MTMQNKPYWKLFFPLNQNWSMFTQYTMILETRGGKKKKPSISPKKGKNSPPPLWGVFSFFSYENCGIQGLIKLSKIGLNDDEKIDRGGLFTIYVTG